MRPFDQKSGVTSRHEFLSVIVKLSTVWFFHNYTEMLRIVCVELHPRVELRGDLPTEQADHRVHTFLKRGKFETL